MKVSVIIPVYNQEELIVRCLDSIPKRDDIEIIVVNDGSTDKTLKSLYDYKKKYSRLKIHSYKNNQGVSVARNKGLNISKGLYVLFIDSDDYIDGNIFNDIVDNDLKFVDMVFYDMIDNTGQEYNVDNHRIMNRVGMFKFTKKSFIGNTRFKEKVQRGEDAIFHERLMVKCPTFICTKKLMYHYNFPRKGSLTDLYNEATHGHSSFN